MHYKKKTIANHVLHASMTHKQVFNIIIFDELSATLDFEDSWV